MVAARLRVVSWNIRAAIGPGPFPDQWWRRVDADRLRAIGAFLSTLEADVVAVQEVAVVSRDGELVDNAGDLARQLGMEARYGAVRTFEVVEDGELRGAGLYGNALLTLRPLSAARTVALPLAPPDALVEPADADHPAAGLRYADAPPTIREPRCALLVEMDGWRIGTAHLSHVGSGERLLQAQALDAAFGGGSPAVLLGDLNAPIEAPELAPLAAWTDAFSQPPGDAARISTDDGYRIDHVLARGASVGACRVAREAGDLSDHYPVVADVRATAEAPDVATTLSGGRWNAHSSPGSPLRCRMSAGLTDATRERTGRVLSGAPLRAEVAIQHHALASGACCVLERPDGEPTAYVIRRTRRGERSR